MLGTSVHRLTRLSVSSIKLIASKATATARGTSTSTSTRRAAATVEEVAAAAAASSCSSEPLNSNGPFPYPASAAAHVQRRRPRPRLGLGDGRNIQRRSTTDTDAIELALDSVVKIFTVTSSPNYFLPWQNKSQRETMGSGNILSFILSQVLEGVLSLNKIEIG